MTTVVYYKGVMASDSSLTYKSEQIGSVQKIWKFKTGALYGARGDGDDRELRALLQGVTNPDAIPSATKLAKIESSIQSLFVLPNGEVWHIGTGEYAEANKVDAEYHAVGSGRKYALGAMGALIQHAHGIAPIAVAQAGVEEAIKHDLHSDGEVQVLKQFIPSGLFFHGFEVSKNSDVINSFRRNDFENGRLKRLPDCPLFPMFSDEKYLHKVS